MRVRQLTIENFRGVSAGQVDFASHALLVGGNNIGKSTVCEALDLVLGPERLFRRPVIDEHDFHQGQYLTEDNKPVEISICALLVDLSDEARRRFQRHLRCWDDTKGQFVDETGTGPEGTDQAGTVWALPVIFIGRYDPAEDDFIGNTFFDHPIEQIDEEDPAEQQLGNGRKMFSPEQKRLCDFVFLRTLHVIVAPETFDLGGDNHRSPSGGIPGFADAVLKNKAPLPEIDDVKAVAYWPNAFAPTVHAAVDLDAEQASEAGN